MKLARIVVVALSLVALSMPFSTIAKQTGVQTMSTAQYLASPQAMADLVKINSHFIDNFIRNDVKSHDALLHPAFLHIDPDGRYQDRASYLKQWATGFDPDVIVYWDVRAELITLVGSTALVRSANKYTVMKEGKPVTGMSSYTDTYVYLDGRWQCIQAQINRVASDAWPPDSAIKTVYLRGVKQ
jgi:Domain of unknown function (DUF4440)